ncbi:class I SAM-dependent methyltransferase [Thermoactinospora rubra]|uniref:class I SAM-dependent methyltransferase n=1 Tax=Thermoactinospora rubra TaxID=1088767 RepID=UPI000A122526|nr:class I SAM-dependent methyltransferase [Thermoactinospora rubra]
MDPSAIGAVFDRTGADFSRLAPHLWDPIGQATVDAAAVKPGDRVLDVCCGAGGSAVPAAVATGPDGSVDAIDLADSLLAQGRERASAGGLTHLRFIRADATTWEDSPYDVAMCVLGVFMLPDMDATASRLTRLVRPGGTFAVTTWASGALENFGIALSDVVQQVRGSEPGSPASRDSVTKIATEQKLSDWLTGLGLREVRVSRVPLALTLTDDLAWLLVVGSGFRGMLDGLDAPALSRIRENLLATLRERGIGTVDATTLVGVGHR